MEISYSTEVQLRRHSCRGSRVLYALNFEQGHFPACKAHPQLITPVAVATSVAVADYATATE